MAGITPEIEDIRAEMARAHEARSQGNEGMARVCARRAVGWAIRRKYADHFQEGDTRSAYVLLKWFRDRSEAPPNLQRAAHRLTVRINEDHQLPHPEDPLLDARLLLTELTPKALS